MRKWGVLLLIVICSTLLLQRLKFTPDKTVLQPDPIAEKTVIALPTEILREDIRDVTPEKVLPAPIEPGTVVERLPAIKPPPPPPKPPRPEVWYNPIPQSAGVIQSGATHIELAGIEPIPLDKICADSNGRDWPCGMFARTSLRSFVRFRPIECDPVDRPDPERITTRCHLSGYDISAWLVWQGWALPTGELFQSELEEAQKKQYGIWRKQAPGY